MAGKHDISLHQGARLSFEITMENDDGTDQGIIVPVDLRNATVDMQIKQNHRSTEPMLDLGANGWIWISDPVAGKITIDVPGSATKDLYIRTAGVYDIIVDFGEGNIIRPLEGLVNFYPGVTL